MSFPRYPEYKDSGVEWLGKVPAHWEVKSLRYILEAIGDVDHFMPESVEKGVPYLMTGDLKEFVSDVSLDDSKQVSRNDYLELSKRIKSSKGDVIMARYATIGTSMYVDIDVDFLVSYSCVTLKTNHSKVIGIYLFQYMKSDAFRHGVENQINTNTQGNVGIKDLQNVKIAVAPIDEQTAIAAFLDRETAKIDALVAEQRRLMALLKEKRQAVISHAVTRGLNPHAPMKSSGIEWLGEVPEHWEVLKGALIGTLFGSEQVPEDAVLDEGDLPFIKVGSLSRDSFEIESWDYFVDRSVAANCRPRSGYIVFPKRGAAIFTNKVNIVDRPSIIDPNLMGWKIGGRAVTAFIAYALKCRKLDELADVSTVPQINNKHIGPERFAVPTIEEQQHIVAYLHAESAKFDTLTTEAQRAIDLLQERRTALISAAVTGQIDVRAKA